jgi:dihydrofolate reductase
MRVLRYNVAASLDGFIADAQGAFDWIPDDPTVDFEGLFAKVDTYLLGRRTYDTVRAQSQAQSPFTAGARIYVFSRTMTPGTENGVTIVRDDPVALARSLRHEEGSGEIWLFGGGELFATLLDAGQVDRVEVTVVPVLLGGGVPLVAHITKRSPLALIHSEVYPTGMVALHYKVLAAEGASR